MKWIKLTVLIWTVKTLQTYNGVAEFLNSLPKERAIEAKVVCSDWNWPCAVFYRVEQPSPAVGR